MMVTKEISIMIEAMKLKLIAKGKVPVSPQIWEQDDDGLMYYTSLLEQLEAL